MKTKKILASLLILLVVALFAGCVTVAPPPGPMPSRAWVPGHWEGPVWMEGHWGPAPPAPRP